MKPPLTRGFFCGRYWDRTSDLCRVKAEVHPTETQAASWSRAADRPLPSGFIGDCQRFPPEQRPPSECVAHIANYGWVSSERRASSSRLRTMLRRTLWRCSPRWLKERYGRRTMDPVEAIHEFWRQPNPEGNEPDQYLKPIGRSRVLAELIDWLPKDARILEVGCNVGRNLAFLHDHGWTNVAGVEISPHAVRLLRKSYPQLSQAEIHVGAAENLLPRMESDSFDLIFTMAVLEHLHPDSRSVFSDIARLSSHVLAIEPDAHVSHRQYPYDIQAEFARVGLRFVTSRRMTDVGEDESDIRNYVASQFTKEVDPSPI